MRSDLTLARHDHRLVLRRLALEREQAAAGVDEAAARHTAAAYHPLQFLLDRRTLRPRIDCAARKGVLRRDPGFHLGAVDLLKPAVILAHIRAEIGVADRTFGRRGIV